jgi:hypothetical protein
MRKGEHVFYALLAGPNGKLGNAASVTLIYNEISPTATPAPTQTASSVLNPSQDGDGMSSYTETDSEETGTTPAPTEGVEETEGKETPKEDPDAG